MRAMILAAGRGERMGALTSQTPKPLLRVGNHYLIEYAIHALLCAGITDIIINIAYLGDQIKAVIGDGSQYGAHIVYSEETERLETGGGIFKALSFFNEQPFIVISSDIITDYPIKKLINEPKGLAHLIMVDNPSYHPHGDYALESGLLHLNKEPKLVFGNIGVYKPALFAGCQPGHFRLTKLLNPAITQGQVTGEHYTGQWHNVGTPDGIIHAREDSSLRPLASAANTL